MAELIWDGKYDEHGKKRAPVRIELPFQTTETVNESVQDRQRALDLFTSGRDTEWRNRLIWGDKKYVLPSLVDVVILSEVGVRKANANAVEGPLDSREAPLWHGGSLAELGVVEEHRDRTGDRWGQGVLRLRSG